MSSDGSAYYRKQRKNIKTSLDHISSLLSYSHAERLTVPNQTRPSYPSTALLVGNATLELLPPGALLTHTRHRRTKHCPLLSPWYSLTRHNIFWHSCKFACLPPVLGATLMAQLAKNPPAMWKTWVQPLGGKDPLEKGLATNSNILAWRIPWTI